ncbi:MAG TPA: UpxY family transcription antiterminator [Flavisolibacter sp.]|jgi:transcription antitermination factor NusG|nr:UpxY family transcription antiterminator [Flavisolibacter sp.]
MNEKWYAVYTKPRWEKKVAELLSAKGISNYCPVKKMIKQWSDRKKVVYEPLFTSYVFVNVTPREQIELREVDGVLNLVYWLGKPAVIRDSEMELIKQFLSEYENVRLERIPIRLNDKVIVTSGPLMENYGFVVAIKNNTVKLALPSLGFLMYAELEKSSVEVIHSKSKQQLNPA